MSLFENSKLSITSKSERAPVTDQKKKKSMSTLERTADVLLEQRAVQSSHHERLVARAASFEGQMRRAYLDVKEAVAERQRRATEISELLEDDNRMDKVLDVTALRFHALTTAMIEQCSTHDVTHKNKEAAVASWAHVPALVVDKVSKRRLLLERRSAVDSFCELAQSVERGVCAIKNVRIANEAALVLSQEYQIADSLSHAFGLQAEETTSRIALLGTTAVQLQSRVATCQAHHSLTTLCIGEISERVGIIDEQSSSFACLTSEFLFVFSGVVEAVRGRETRKYEEQAAVLSNHVQSLFESHATRTEARQAAAAELALRKFAADKRSSDAAHSLEMAHMQHSQKAAAHVEIETEAKRSCSTASRTFKLVQQLLMNILSANEAVTEQQRVTTIENQLVAEAARRELARQHQIEAQLEQFAAARTLVEAEESRERDRVEDRALADGACLFQIFSALIIDLEAKEDYDWIIGEERFQRGDLRSTMTAERASYLAASKRGRQDDRQQAMPPPSRRALQRSLSNESEWSIFKDPVKIIPRPRNGGAASTRPSQRMELPMPSPSRGAADPSRSIQRMQMSMPSPAPRRPTLVLSTNLPPQTQKSLKPRVPGKAPVSHQKVKPQMKDDNDIFDDIFGPF